MLVAEFGKKNDDFTFVSTPFYAGTPLAKMEFEGEGSTTWNPARYDAHTLDEIFDPENANV